MNSDKEQPWWRTTATGNKSDLFGKRPQQDNWMGFTNSLHRPAL